MSVFKISKEDLKKIGTVFIREIGLFIFMVFVLFFDSIYFSDNIKEVQNILNFLMIVGFFIMYFRTVKRVQELMIYAVVIGFLGEYLFSKYLGMYTYRLGDIPLYVPFVMPFYSLEFLDLVKYHWLESFIKVLNNFLAV